jgi:DNA-binding CsgD family transcriptional regulator/signal transduction histidine kinase
MTGDPDNEGLISYKATAAVETERRRLAELLDHHVINPLNLLLAQANAYEQTFAANPQARMAVSVLASLARQLMQQTRDLQDNLNPTILETLGLEAALEALASQYMRTYGLRVRLKIERLRERLPLQIELALFRTAQAGLERANQAHASKASLSLEHRESLMIFELADDGISLTGFDGLNLMRQWVEQLGGVFESRSDKQGESVLTIRFALKPFIEITAREMDVIQLAAEGLTNKEIASKLSLSARTVNFHLDNIYSKLNVSTRTEAAVYALRQGWIKRPD